jgi:hypothetical protein
MILLLQPSCKYCWPTALTNLFLWERIPTMSLRDASCAVSLATHWNVCIAEKEGTECVVEQELYHVVLSEELGDWR